MLLPLGGASPPPQTLHQVIFASEWALGTPRWPSIRPGAGVGRPHAVGGAGLVGPQSWCAGGAPSQYAAWSKPNVGGGWVLQVYTPRGGAAQRKPHGNTGRPHLRSRPLGCAGPRLGHPTWGIVGWGGRQTQRYWGGKGIAGLLGAPNLAMQGLACRLAPTVPQGGAKMQTQPLGPRGA